MRPTRKIEIKEINTNIFNINQKKTDSLSIKLKNRTLAQILENNRLISTFAGASLLFFIFYFFLKKGFSLDLNIVSWSFLGLGLILSSSSIHYVKLVNMFIPSGGGQWAVQGPVMIEAAENLEVEPFIIVLGVAYGDQWTNMIQPFWTIPLLAIAGLHMRQIMGYTFVIFLVTGFLYGGAMLLLGSG